MGHHRDEQGVILLFALLFLTAVSLMVGGLLTLGLNGLGATSTLHQVLQTQYAADGAVQDAMTALAQPGNFTVVENWPLGTSQACPSLAGATTNPLTLGGTPAVYTYCTYSHNAYPGAAPQNDVRTYDIVACTGTDPTCATSPQVRANVTLSHFAPPLVATVTINDWSVLYGKAT